MPQDAPTPEQRGYARPDLLVTTGWLQERLDDTDIVIVDQDPPAAYGRAHIPGAVNYLDHWYKETPGGVYVQDPRTFARTMESMGIGDDTLVVAYDSDGAHWAARLYWCLRYYGHDNVKVLDGGFPKWFAEGRRLSRERPEPTPASFTSKPVDELYADKDEVLRRSGDPESVLWDVRTDEEWNGQNARGTARAGRVPNAVHLEWKNCLTQDDVPVIKPAHELRSQLESIGVTPDKRVVTYCQGGIRASHGFFILELLGYPNTGVYDGSWREWGNATGYPVELPED